MVSSESGDLLYWSLADRSVVFQERQENIRQILFFRSQTRCLAVSEERVEGAGRVGRAVARAVPTGNTIFTLQFPFREFRPVVITPGEAHIVCLGWELGKVGLEIRNSDGDS